jgi:hypothetical protein
LRVTPYLLHRQLLELEDGSDRDERESGLEPPEERDDNDEPTDEGGETVPILYMEAFSSLSQSSSTGEAE